MMARIKKTVQYILLIIYIGIVLVVFFGHFIEHISQIIDKKYIVVCPQILTYHRVIILKNGFSPSILKASVCDEVVFINKDIHYHEIAFGDHPYHLLYPGYNERSLSPDASISALLRASGRYKFHDHLNEKLEGSIIISPLN